MGLRQTIQTDYDTIKSTDTARTSLPSMELQGAIAYAKNELRKNPKDPVLQGWLTIIAQREIDNSEVKAQLEELKDFVDTDGKRIIPAPIVDRSIRSTMVATLGNVPIPVQTQSATAQNGVQEVKDALAEINPENLEKAVRTSEKFINILPDGQTKSTLRGIHGAIIFDILRSAGHNLTMQNGQIMIIPKPGTDIVNLQEKLQTLVNTNRISLDTIKLGMLYSSPSFSKYAEMKKTKDASGKDIIDPKASTGNFIMYLNDLQKAGNKSGDIESILKSQSLLVGVNMPQAIAGFNDMGQIGAWMEKNADKVKDAVNTGAVAAGGNAPANAPPAPNTPNIPSAPSNRFTAQLGQDGKTGGAVTGIAKDSAGGLFGGISDIFKLANGDSMAQLGIGAAMIYGVYKLFSKLGFFGGVGTLFGIGALNSGSDIFSRIEKLFDGGSTKPATPATTTSPAAGTGTTNTPTAQPAAAPASTLDISKLTPSQKKMYDKITADKTFTQSIDTFGSTQATQKKVEIAKSDAYLEFIFSDKFQKLSLEKYIYTSNPDISIFRPTETLDPSLSVPNTMNNALLKKMLLLALTGSPQRQLVTGKTLGDKEKGDFIAKYPDTNWKTKTTVDIIAEIHK